MENEAIQPVTSKPMGPRFTIGGFGNSFYIREAGKGPVSGLTNLSREGAEAALAKLYDDPLQDAIRNNRDGIAERIIENAFKG